MVKFYSTHCPKCKILQKKLNLKNIEYLEINDIDEMTNRNFLTVPKLEVDGVVMDFEDAVKWVNLQENSK